MRARSRRASGVNRSAYTDPLPEILDVEEYTARGLGASPFDRLDLLQVAQDGERRLQALEVGGVYNHDLASRPGSRS